MTTITSTQKFAPTGIFNFVYSVEKFLANRSIYKKTVRELSCLNERELQDLGLCRADIAIVAKQAVAMR